jgi:hypothetical protein
VAAIVDSADLPADVASNAMSGMWIDGANARASRIAPCLAAADPAPTAEQMAEAKLVLIGAIMRWSEAGSGALQAETIGPFAHTVDTRQRGGFNLWPSEIVQLQDICKNGAESQAFSVDTVRNTFFFNHLEFCSIFFGGACSCGASIAWQPIFEQ